MTRSRLGAVALLLATFVLGGLVGGAASTMADRRQHGHPRPSFVERLSADLDLTTAQRDSIQAVLDRHQPAMDSLWKIIRPQFQSERQSIRNQITALLTAEQQTKYATLQRQDSLRRAEGERRGNAHR